MSNARLRAAVGVPVQRGDGHNPPRLSVYPPLITNTKYRVAFKYSFKFYVNVYIYPQFEARKAPQYPRALVAPENASQT